MSRSENIADGEYVATVFDMEMVSGVDQVVDLCRFVNGELTEIRAFYYPGQGPG